MATICLNCKSPRLETLLGASYRCLECGVGGESRPEISDSEQHHTALSVPPGVRQEDVDALARQTEPPAPVAPPKQLPRRRRGVDVSVELHGG